MTPPIPFTRDDIRRQIDAGTYARGESYLRNEKVVDFDDDRGRIYGEVQGSGRNVYEQRIRLTPGRDGVRIDGQCSCPMAHNCKHVVAVLLAWLERRDAGAGGTGIPFAAESWLQHLDMARLAVQAQALHDGRSDQCALYVLMPDPDEEALNLHLCKARLRKDGSIGTASLQNNLHGLLAHPQAFMERDDLDAIRLMLAQFGARVYEGEARPEGRIGARLLDELCGQERLWLAQRRTDIKAGRLLPVAPGPVRRAAPAWLEDAGDPGTVGLRWCFDDGARIQHVLATEPMRYLHDGNLGELALPEALAGFPPGVLLALMAHAPVLAAEQRAPVAARLAELGLDRLFPVPQDLQVRERRDVVPTPCLLLDSEPVDERRGWTWHDYARLSFDYDGLSTEDTDAPALRRADGDMVDVIVRDEAAERAAVARLAALGFAPPRRGEPLHGFVGVLQLPAPADWLPFARHDMPQLEAAGWRIELGGNYRYEITDIDEWYADLAEEGEDVNGWFALELGIVVEGKRHPLLPLLLQMIRAAPAEFDEAALAARDDAADVFVHLPGSSHRVALPWGRIKPILATLGELYFAERIGDSIRLSAIDAARLAELEQAAQMRWLGGERLRALGRKLARFDGVRAVAAPAGLQAQLRPYQLAGLAWMQFLREYDCAGILADDMGLGKTVQTLSHILAEKEAGRLDAPALVVAPTTLMSNWQAEAARFAPGLRVVVLHGKDRKDLFDEAGGADLVLTTYALLGRDEEALRRHRYHLLILDEAQYIKNSRAKAAQVVRLLDARHRLCLTGTPVQNHLGELWSQFHFLMPGLLGDEKTFNRDFRKPIEQQGDAQRAALLARRVKPFMLRRTKDKVATELPPKTEIVLPVDLGGQQRDLYETVRLAMERRVQDEVDRKGLARSQIVILDALLKLRQVCCDPRLLKTGGDAGSAKLDALLELLDTLLSEGRKVLVFSQFTSMLALVEAALQARGIAYALLTGDTDDRAAPVAAFQQGRVAVFLISLKAGGVGLNLTAADTVIHYDPWWNPASEDQATDRAWRIGQDQPVFVYKLIARGTLEEKIQDMQRRKGELAHAVLAPEGGLAAAVGPDDLRALFSV